MDKTISATQARIHFGELMRSAQEEPIIVERDGQPQVVVLSKRAYDSLLAAQPQLSSRQLLQEAHRRIRQETAGKRLPDPAYMLAQVREERGDYDDHLR